MQSLSRYLLEQGKNIGIQDWVGLTSINITDAVKWLYTE